MDQRDDGLNHYQEGIQIVTVVATLAAMSGLVLISGISGKPERNKEGLGTPYIVLRTLVG